MLWPYYTGDRQAVKEGQILELSKGKINPQDLQTDWGKVVVKVKIRMDEVERSQRLFLNFQPTSLNEF